MWRDTAAFGCVQSPEGTIAAVPCCDGTVHIISLANNSVSATRTLNVAAELDEAVMCTSAAFRDDGHELAVLASDGSVLSYDCRTWLPSFKLSAVDGCMDLCWLPDVCPSPLRNAVWQVLESVVRAHGHGR